MAKKDEKLSTRERIALRLVLMIVKILQPYEYTHEYADTYKAIEQELKLTQ